MNPDDAGAPVNDPKPDPILEELKALREEMSTKIAEVDTKNEERFSQFAEQIKPPEPAPAPAEQAAWQPKTWDDFPRLVEEKGAEVAQKIIDARDAEYNKQQQESQAVQERITKEIDDQLADLEKQGVLPKVENQNNPQDAGVAARRELLALGVYLETPNLVKVAEQMKTNHEAGYAFDVTTNSWTKQERQLPGQYAPVGSSSARSSAPGTSGPSYETINKARNFDDLIQYADQNGYGPVPRFE